MQPASDGWQDQLFAACSHAYGYIESSEIYLRMSNTFHQYTHVFQNKSVVIIKN